MSDPHSESSLATVFDELPEPTEENVAPCQCGLADGMYNMGQFHLRHGEVVGWCHEYRELAAQQKRGLAAKKSADPFTIETQRLNSHLALIKCRLDELKRGGCNR